ncbi:MAG TPA: hypothetical protein VHA70_13375 [Bauldia sp.]|nr:hypothetical protein [Bauldia sp.]
MTPPASGDEMNAADGMPQVYTVGPIGGRDVFALIGGVPYQITSSGDNFSPSVTSRRINYVSAAGGVHQESVTLPAEGSVAPFATRLLHIISSGQSLSMGGTSDAVTMRPPVANRLYTIFDGVRLTDQDATLTPAMVTPFKPLVAKLSEIPLVQLSAQLNRLRGLPSDAALLSSAHGRNGKDIASLGKGTVYYNNAITAVTAARAEAGRLGLGYRVALVDWIQGEDDCGRPPGAYLADLVRLQADYDTDMRAITHQSERVPMLLDQISNWTSYGMTDCLVPLEQLQAALDFPDRFACAGPKYWVPTNTDGRHLTSDSYTRIGAMHARAAMGMISGDAWKPTHAISAKRSGATIMLSFHTPFGPLVKDDVNVGDPGNLGIRYIDDSGSAAVKRARVLGDNVVEVDLTAVPDGANPYIGIADAGQSGQPGGPFTGARSCLRDSSPDLDAHGRPVFNWACHQRIPVTPT